MKYDIIPDKVLGKEHNIKQSQELDYNFTALLMSNGDIFSRLPTETIRKQIPLVASKRLDMQPHSSCVIFLHQDAENLPNQEQ